jgi:hypothetical protein
MNKTFTNPILPGFNPDPSILSDDALTGWSLTGTFVGLCSQDLSGPRRANDGDFFAVEEAPSEVRRCPLVEGRWS